MSTADGEAGGGRDEDPRLTAFLVSVQVMTAALARWHALTEGQRDYLGNLLPEVLDREGLVAPAAPAVSAGARRPRAWRAGLPAALPIAALCAVAAAGRVAAPRQAGPAPPTETERAIGRSLAEQRTNLGAVAVEQAELEALLATYYAERRVEPPPPPAVGCPDPWRRPIVVWNAMEVQPGQVVEDTLLAGCTWTGLGYAIQVTPLTGLVIRRSAIMQSQKWGSRAYRVETALVEEVTIDGVVAEHGVYWNLRGGTPVGEPAIVFRRALFRNCGSQGIQLVYRPQEQGFDFEAAGDGAPGGVILVEDCRFENCDFNMSGMGRASYPLSFFWSPHDVEVRGTVVDSTMQGECRGAIMIDSHGRAVVEDCEFLLGDSDRPNGLFERVGDLQIRRCRFESRSGQQVVKINQCGSVTVEGCTGNVRLRIDGVDVGPITTTITPATAPRLPEGAARPREVPLYTREARADGLPVPD